MKSSLSYIVLEVLKKKSGARFVKFAPLRHFAPSLFQLNLHMLVLGSNSLVLTPNAESAFNNTC